MEIMTDEPDMASGGSSGDEMQDQKHYDPNNDDIENEFVKARTEMKQMSLGELIQLEERLGTKIFNEVYHGCTESTAKKDNIRKNIEKKDSKKTRRFQLERPLLHKDGPTEFSSKKPTSRFRNVVLSQKRKGRDPRFDDYAGEYNEEIFSSNYAFLKDIEAREKDELQTKIKNEADAETRKQLKLHLRCLKRSEASEIKRQTKREQLKVVSQREKELVKRGKKPFFMKKSEEKNVELIEQYKKLKDSGRLETYMKAKRKKNAQKNRHKMPDNLL